MVLLLTSERTKGRAEDTLEEVWKCVGALAVGTKEVQGRRERVLVLIMRRYVVVFGYRATSCGF